MIRKLIQKLFPAKGPSAIATGRSILIIDDGEVERKVTSEILRKRGFTVFSAENGERGVEMAKQEKPDLILLDYLMPGLNGKDVCERLKQIETTKNIPVIFLTGSVQPKSVIDCYEVGAEYYLAKPVTPRLLINQVEMIFKELNLPPKSSKS